MWPSEDVSYSNLHLSWDTQSRRRNNCATWGSGHPIRKTHLAWLLPSCERAATCSRPLNLKTINRRCQTKYCARFLPLQFANTHFHVGRTFHVVPPGGPPERVRWCGFRGTKDRRGCQSTTSWKKAKGEMFIKNKRNKKIKGSHANTYWPCSCKTWKSLNVVPHLYTVVKADRSCVILLRQRGPLHPSGCPEHSGKGTLEPFCQRNTE